LLGTEALSVRYPGVLAIPGVAPGVKGFILRTGEPLFPHGRRIIRPAPAYALGAGEARPLATVALDHYPLRTSPVDPAELHVLNLVTPFGPLDHVHRPDIPFPTRRCIQ